jgi:hypothetical protein
MPQVLYGKYKILLEIILEEKKLKVEESKQ